jgi:hypothetical protein
VRNARDHFAAAENVHKGCSEILYILYVQLCREFCRNDSSCLRFFSLRIGFESRPGHFREEAQAQSSGQRAPTYASGVLLFLMAPAGVAMMLWLLVKGVDMEKWRARFRQPSQ